jgi:hypothetical protein
MGKWAWNPWPLYTPTPLKEFHRSPSVPDERGAAMPLWPGIRIGKRIGLRWKRTALQHPLHCTHPHENLDAG